MAKDAALKKLVKKHLRTGSSSSNYHRPTVAQEIRTLNTSAAGGSIIAASYPLNSSKERKVPPKTAGEGRSKTVTGRKKSRSKKKKLNVTLLEFMQN